MFRLVVFFISITLGLSPAFAQADIRSATAASSSIPLRGTLYRIDHGKRSSWLFGTVHAGQAAFYPLEPQVMQALHDSDALVVETDIRNTAAMQQAVLQHGLYAENDHLGYHLPPAERIQLEQSLAAADIPFAHVQRMKPWMIANVLLVHAMAQAGFPPEQGLEQHFLQLAARQHKPVHELEDAAYALSLFDTMPPSQQRAYLQETLRELQDGSGVAKGVAMIHAWQASDSAQLDAEYRNLLTEDSVIARFTRDMLLDHRNPRMADGIIQLLQNGQTLFVAVGALHLLGPRSIPALLSQHGYHVTRLY